MTVIPSHFDLAEHLAEQADTWLDADRGWHINLSSEERLARRAGDYQAAQVHATLALVEEVRALAKTVELVPGAMP